jgi:hypothetical protein
MSLHTDTTLPPPSDLPDDTERGQLPLPLAVVALTATELRERGWTAGTRGVDARGLLIDEHMARESTCEACGFVGLTAEPWVKLLGTETVYRVFRVCPACAHREEF